jgi:serine/threonine-protein kinase PknK
MSLRRLGALVENERIRLGLPVHPEFGALPVTSYDARRRPVDVIDEITVQHEEATAIRTLLVGKDPAQRDLACRWAQEWVDRLTAQNRPRALLQARRLLVACLAAAERSNEAKVTLTTIAAQCAQFGTVRYLVDGGPHVVATLAQLRADQQAGRWRSEWPEVPADFLDRLVNAEAVQRI